MGFKFQSDGAQAGKNDGSWSSFALTALHANVTAIATERLPAVAVAFPVDSPQRWTSPWPMAHGPFWIYLHEPFGSIDVVLRIDAVEIAGLSIFATCGSPAAVDTPPHDREDWQSSAAGAALTVTATPTTQTLTVSTGGRRGWIAVYVWTWCDWLAGSESSGTITGFQAVGGVAIEHDTGTEISGTNPPERVFIHNVQAANNATPTPAGPVYMIGGWEALSGDEGVFLIPPVPPGGSGLRTATYSIHKIGIVVVPSISLRAVQTAYNAPPVEAFYIDEPVKDIVHMTLVRGLATMIASRRPQWTCHPGLIMTPTGGTLVPWLLRYDTASGTERLDSTFRPIAAAVAAEEPADLNGIRAIVSVALYSQHGASSSRGSVRLEFRARAVELDTGTEIAVLAGSRVVTVPVSDPITTGSIIVGTYDGLAHTAYGSQAFGAWQGRGGFPSAGAANWAAPLARQTHTALEWDETGITYPCAIVIEVRLYAGPPDYTDYHTDCLVTGCAVAARGLDD